jgi:glycosyltransferase involved in cell wall biosynthesis
MKNPLDNSNNAIISVVIPAYNSAQYLLEAIDSVLNQTHAGCEIIVVDDGSTDETKVVCEQYSTIKYVYQSNQGLPAARNRGVEASSGQFSVFLDSDDCQEQSSYILDRIAYRFSSKDEEDFLAKSLYKLEDLTPQLLDILNCNIQAGEDYTAKKYAGKMVLFRCQVQDLEHYLHPEFGWPDLVEGGVDIHPIPEPHFRMLKEPRIRFLAAELKLFIQKISTDSIP